MTPVRDARYLAFIRKQPCLFCQQAPAGHAHHEGKREAGGGTSLKGCDYHTVPLCGLHHTEYHQRARIGFWSVEETQRRFTRAIERRRQQWEQLKDGPQQEEFGEA